MSVEYFLKIDALGSFPKISIDEIRFLKLKASKEILSEALAIEEKYEIIISNYLDLEKESNNLSLNAMVCNHTEYSDFFDERLKINICMVNFLTSVRLYKDSLGGHVSTCLPLDKNIEPHIKNLFSIEYDKNFEFRFLEALRNYTQHKATPVHSVSTNGKKIDTNDFLLEFSMSFYTLKDILAESGSFKNKILLEMPDKVDLLLATRVYIESISFVHSKARELLLESVKDAKEFLEKAIGEYKMLHPSSTVALKAFKLDGEDKIDRVSLFLEWDSVRIRLEKRNKKLTKFSKRYVTGQAQKPK